MATVTYKYVLDQEVWIIIDNNSCPIAVQEGVVSNIRINIFTSNASPTTTTDILYSILIKNNTNPTVFLEKDVFASESDAMLEYSTRLNAL